MCHVYVIDDDPIHQKISNILLKTIGVFKRQTNFLEAQSAMQALIENKGTAEELPDIILLDLNMPIVNGWDFLDQYTEIRSELIKESFIYIVSSSTISSEIERSANYPSVKEFIVKPLEIEKLQEIHNRHCKLVI